MKTLTLGLTFTLLTALTACAGDAGKKDAAEDSSAADDSSSTGDDDSGGDDSKGSDDSEAPDNDKDNDGYDADEDCDDNDRRVNPGATETCDGVDNDCDGDVDDADGSVTGQSECYIDNDLDGYGAGAAVGSACECPEGQASLGEDCDDDDFYRSPGTVEECDGGIDNDCDELVDADDPSLAEGNTYYLDKDGDKYGDDETGIRSCSRIAGRITTGGDCDDGDKTINPGVEEICEDAIDNDCADGVDDGCGGDTGDTGDTGGSVRFEGWQGTQLYYYSGGGVRNPNVFVCEMYWSSLGVGSSNVCPDCDYAFDVDFTYDTVNSSYSDADCEAYVGDFSLTLAYDADYYYPDYGPVPSLFYYNASDASWEFYSVGWFDTTSYVIYNYWGYFNAERSGKYYTDLWYGWAYVY